MAENIPDWDQIAQERDEAFQKVIRDTIQQAASAQLSAVVQGPDFDWKNSMKDMYLAGAQFAFEAIAQNLEQDSQQNPRSTILRDKAYTARVLADSWKHL